MSHIVQGNQKIANIFFQFPNNIYVMLSLSYMSSYQPMANYSTYALDMNSFPSPLCFWDLMP
jgi:hypothetical protein